MTTTHTPSTLLALHDADPEGLREIVLKLLGWKKWQDEESGILGGDWSKFIWTPPDKHEKHFAVVEPPSFTSLDAVAELEAGLTDEEFRMYLWYLELVCTGKRGVFKQYNEGVQLSDCLIRSFVSAKPHLRLIAWVLTKQTI